MSPKLHKNQATLPKPALSPFAPTSGRLTKANAVHFKMALNPQKVLNAVFHQYFEI